MIDDMAVYIANLGKYNEGYLVGAWFTFPIDEEDVKEKIGLNEQYEEYAIHDTDNFPIAITLLVLVLFALIFMGYMSKVVFFSIAGVIAIGQITWVITARYLDKKM